MADCCNDKACEIDALKGKQTATLKVVLGINAMRFGLEISTGVAVGSVALVADSLDMLGDALVYGFSIYAVSRSAGEKAYSALLKGSSMAAFGVVVLAQAFDSALHPATPVVGVDQRFWPAGAGCQQLMSGVVAAVTQGAERQNS